MDGVKAPSMAVFLPDNPRARRHAMQAQGDMDRGPTVNPSATPVRDSSPTANPGATLLGTGGGGSRPWTWDLKNRPSNNTADMQANANRNGAFGTGAQNLQGRRDLFKEMGSVGKGGFNTPEFKSRAQALGVTEQGWANAARKLSPDWGNPQAAAPAPIAQASVPPPIAPVKTYGAVADATPQPSVPTTPAAPATAPQPGGPQPGAPTPGQTIAPQAPAAPIAPAAAPAPISGIAQAAAIPPVQPGAMLRPAAPSPGWAQTAGIKPPAPAAQAPTQPTSKPPAAKRKAKPKWYENDMSNPDRFAGSPVGRGLSNVWNSVASAANAKPRYAHRR